MNETPVEGNTPVTYDVTETNSVKAATDLNLLGFIMRVTLS
jgi:hypothetical protein